MRDSLPLSRSGLARMSSSAVWLFCRWASITSTNTQTRGFTFGSLLIEYTVVWPKKQWMSDWLSEAFTYELIHLFHSRSIADWTAPGFKQLKEVLFTWSLVELLPSKLASLWIEELTVSFSCLTAAGRKKKKKRGNQWINLKLVRQNLNLSQIKSVSNSRPAYCTTQQLIYTDWGYPAGFAVA